MSITSEIDNEQRLWELTKYTITELQDEIDRRLQEKANLYAVKDVIDFDENGEPFNTEAI